MKPNLFTSIGLYCAGPAVRAFMRRQDVEIMRLRQEQNELLSQLVVIRGELIASPGCDPECSMCRVLAKIKALPGMPQ